MVAGQAQGSQAPGRQRLETEDLVDLAGHQGRPTDDLTGQPYCFSFMFNSFFCFVSICAVPSSVTP